MGSPSRIRTFDGSQDGTQVTFRVMRPEDADIEQALVRGLSKATRRLRFFSALNELPPSLLHPFTHPDYPASYALIATIEQSGVEQIISVARYNTTQQDGVVEFAIVVADKWQRFGVANRLLRGLIAAAAIAGYDRLEGIVLRENRPMLNSRTNWISPARTGLTTPMSCVWSRRCGSSVACRSSGFHHAGWAPGFDASRSFGTRQCAVCYNVFFNSLLAQEAAVKPNPLAGKAARPKC